MLNTQDDKRNEHASRACSVVSTSNLESSFDLSEQSFQGDGAFQVEERFSLAQDVGVVEEVVLHEDEPLISNLQTTASLTEESIMGKCVSFVKSCLTKENLLIAANLAGQAAAVGSFIGLILAA